MVSGYKSVSSEPIGFRSLILVISQEKIWYLTSIKFYLILQNVILFQLPF